jgi:hypothetical protein
VSQFTITSAPEDPYVSVHIRQVGDWTHGLGELIGVGPSVVSSLTKAAMAATEKDEKSGPSRGDFVEIDSSRALPQVQVDGPYGAPAEDVFNVEVAVLVGAGIGVTPFASILKHIWYRQKRGNLGALKRVEFFWVCRDAPSFGWFQSLLQEVEAAQADREHFLFSLLACVTDGTASELPAHQHLPDAEDRRGHALEHRRQRRRRRLRPAHAPPHAHHVRPPGLEEHLLAHASGHRGGPVSPGPDLAAEDESRRAY